ncbi:hypothetical protein LNP05_08545 [Klebsiella pneumoniae subsp. pneumoniae]|nr:hypothetical protein [Klebsiella pneumoniae subsp. pneumoniae]
MFLTADNEVVINEINTPAGLYQHQHVSEAVAGQRSRLHQPDHPPD